MDDICPDYAVFRRCHKPLVLPVQVPEFEVVKIHAGVVSARYDNSVDLVASRSIDCRIDQSVVEIDPQILVVQNEQDSVLLRLEVYASVHELDFF